MYQICISVKCLQQDGNRICTRLSRQQAIRKLVREANIMQDYVEQRDGGYFIAGTRIALDGIVLAFKDGEPPETIL